MRENTLELSNYWDDFQIRVNETIDCLRDGRLPKLDRLTVHLTDGCNFACRYCNMRFSKNVMDKEMAFRIADEYADMGGRVIHFTGGEPSTVSYIEELFAYAKSKGLTVSANSNCFKRMNVENVDKLKASFDIVDEDEFDSMMNRHGAFSSVVDNLKYYSGQMTGKMLSITAVLSARTYRNMLRLAQFVHENFKVYNLYFSNYKGDNPEFAFTEAEIEDMFTNHIPKVLDYFKEVGEEYSHRQLSLYKPTDFINSPVRFEENRCVPCYIQLSEMTIDTHGNCYNCSHLYRDGVKPETSARLSEHSLGECFRIMKESLGGCYTCLSDKCLSGCNTNLIGFNRAVNAGNYI